MCYAAIVCFGLCPCQHNGTYTWNVYPATPTKKPAQILHFAESENEPLSRKNSGKAAQNALGKGTGPSNLPKSILASFCHASKNGRKKARKSFYFPLQGHKLSPLCEGADFSAPSSCSLRLMPGIEGLRSVAEGFSVAARPAAWHCPPDRYPGR